MANFEPIFEKLMKKEGGFQNKSSDVGNYCNGKLIGTKYGISATGFQGYFKRCPTDEEMRNLDLATAKKIWKSGYWDAIQGDKLNNISIAELILDGVGGGKNGWLHTRQAINKSYGKQVVPESYTMKLSNSEVDLINKLDAKLYFQNLYDIRYNYFINHSQYAIYGADWISRLKGVYASFTNTVSKYKVPILGIALLAIGVSAFLYYKLKK